MPDGLAGFYSDGDIPEDTTLSDHNKVRLLEAEGGIWGEG